MNKKDGHRQQNVRQFLKSALAHFFAHFGLSWIRTNRGKYYMDGKRIQCLSNASQHVYPSVFNRLRAIARYSSEIATFSYTRAFNTVRVFPLEFRGKVWSSEN